MHARAYRPSHYNGLGGGSGVAESWPSVWVEHVESSGAGDAAEVGALLSVRVERGALGLDECRLGCLCSARCQRRRRPGQARRRHRRLLFGLPRFCVTPPPAGFGHEPPASPSGGLRLRAASAGVQRRRDGDRAGAANSGAEPARAATRLRLPGLRLASCPGTAPADRGRCWPACGAARCPPATTARLR